MSRDYSLYLYDILEACQSVQEYTYGQTFAEFVTDKKTQDAVIRNLEIIGEAVKNIPSELLATRTEIEWKQIARFRDNVIHRYFGVQLTIVWDIVENKLGELETAVRDMIENYPDGAE
ncbi:MAG: DUF86 domain-containing protein [Acidobacteria bacterium]|nr:DUF86 domain-containing protein [Acidobacteriota bacterium]